MYKLKIKIISTNNSGGPSYASSGVYGYPHLPKSQIIHLLSAELLANIFILCGDHFNEST
jgi:hypothetical protein